MGLLRKFQSTESLSSDGSPSIPVFVLPHNFSKRVVIKFAIGVALFALLAAISSVGLQSSQAGSSTSTPKSNLIMSPPAIKSTSPNSSAPLQSTANSTTSTDISTSKNSGSNVHVSVNGQNIPVPKNGSVQKTINETGNSSTNVDVSSTDSGSGSSVSTNSSSTSVNVNSSSTSDSSNVTVQDNSQSP